MWDVDDNEYIDYLLGYGPLILGHAHPRLAEAVNRQVRLGTIYGTSHQLEVDVAQRLVDLVPSIEQVRFGQSGTEVVQLAIRLARAATGRRAVIKFEGHYHGWADQVAVSYAPGAADAGERTSPTPVPMSEGQAPGTYEDITVLEWNDLQCVKEVFARRGDQIAAVLTEPIACNYGVIEPEAGYLEGLRQLCDDSGALLIFDEVQTGVRLHARGAQGYYGVSADLTCMGKAISGGFPVSVLGGRMDVMQLIADRRVFHAGTYNTNPLCLAAIPVVLDRLAEEGTFEEMSQLSFRLRRGLAEIIRPYGGYVQGTTTMFGVAFGPGPIRAMRDGWKNDSQRLMEFKKALRLRGIYTKPTARDIWYVSTEHTQEDVDRTLFLAAEAAGELTPP